MKPVKLIMEGFGSYIKRTEIDFTAFGDNALFLITGSTGGGKTTILDAICFALYGKATGGLRSWEQMRSIGADESIPTSVDFTFTVGAKAYRFYRSQTLYRGRRDGAVKIRVENSCYDVSDGEKLLESGADRSVSAKAQALLGLDCDQFSRVMILPQGEFRRLLLSQSSEKAKLFEKLFDAQQWSKITDCTIKRADEVKEEALKLQSNRLAVLSACGCDSVSQLEEKATAASEKYKQARQAAETLDKAFKTKQSQAERLKKRDELKSTVEKSLISLEQARNEQKAAQVSLANAEKSIETLAQLQNEINRERENARQLDEALNALAKIAQAQKELSHCTATLEKAREQRLALEAKTQELQKKTAAGEGYTAALRCEIQRIPSEIMKLQTLSEINESYKTLEELKLRLTAAKKEAEATEKSYNSSLLELEALKESEKAIDEKIRGNMSVFLSSRLESGKPCPVCGSTEHPHPAVFTGEKEQGLVKKQKELLRLIKEKESRCSELLRVKSEKAAVCVQINEQLNEQQKKCDGYNIYYKTCQHDLEVQRHTLDELNAKKAKLPTAEKQLAALKTQLEQTGRSSGELTDRIIKLEAARAQSQERIN
ncbi:MAG: AAA family ATPase, partial [Acutalibacteraceae bacterium]